jgi:hypothetical protein
MKKITFLILLSIIVISCKNNEEKSTEKANEPDAAVEINNSEDIIYKGDFIYIADAAVLKGEKFIYGVTLDEMTTELANRVKSVKETDFDMVPVAVKGVINPKPKGQEGWDEIITITEIVMVGTKPSKIDIKIEEKKE